MRRQWALAILVAFVAGSLMTGTMASAQSSDFIVDSFFDVFYEIDVSSQQCTNPNEIPKINPDFNGIECSSDFVVDSFFDIFYGIEETSKLLGEIFGDPDFDRLFGDPDFDTIGSLQETDEGLQFQIDSFFDVFFGVSEEGNRNTIEPLVQLFGDPDFQVDSFFDIFVWLDKRDRHFDTEILSMDLRVSNLEDTQTQASTTGMFIKIGDIKGESVESSHEKWSDVTGFGQGQSVPEPSGESRRRADVQLNDLVVVKFIDKASPKIAEAVLTGKVFPKVELDLTALFGDTERLVYYTYELENARVTSYNISGSGQGDDRPTETFSLNFEEIKVTYTEYDSDGNVKGSVEYTWNVEEGQS